MSDDSVGNGPAKGLMVQFGQAPKIYKPIHCRNEGSDGRFNNQRFFQETSFAPPNPSGADGLCISRRSVQRIPEEWI